MLLGKPPGSLQIWNIRDAEKNSLSLLLVLSVVLGSRITGSKPQRPTESRQRRIKHTSDP